MLPADAPGEQATSTTWRVAAAQVESGGFSSCAIHAGGAVRCWGVGGSGRLGYGNEETIGDDETPGTAGPVRSGPGARLARLRSETPTPA